MTRNVAKLTLLVIAILVLGRIGEARAFAQPAPAALSGTVTGPSGTIVGNAKVTIRNVATGQSSETTSDAAGAYTLANLPPGDYEVSVSAEGFGTNTVKVVLAAGATQTVNLTVPPAPGKPGAPSLSDLGFSSEQMKGSAEEQARLDKRSHMLRIHQRLGLITAAPLAATVIMGAFAGGGGRRPTPNSPPAPTSSTDRTIHAVLGAATVGMYFTTASFAIFAPKVKGTQTRGQIRAHKALAWIHGTGMVLTPVLGAMAYAQRSRGERVHGAASYHGAVGIVTAGAYAAAILSVSVKF